MGSDPLELKLPCRLPSGKFCAKCCYDTEMPLTRRDIERIKRLGYPEEYFVAKGRDGIPRLKNINGHCVFLDPETGKCRIYPWRPLGCRLYPLVCMPGYGVIIDPECPLASMVDEDTIRRLKHHVKKLVREVYGERIEC